MTTAAPGQSLRIGVVSDTHGLLRAEVISALQGCDHILHAGDVGDPAILEALAKVAPLTAIRGNIDEHGKCRDLPPVEIVELGGRSIYMLHDLEALDLDPGVAGMAAVISGHSHKAAIKWRQDILYFNPGSCGPRRFSLPLSMGFLEITASEIKATLHTL